MCLTTDVPGSPRFAYVGIDHTKAGRTAGFIAARMARRAGSALALTHGMGFGRTRSGWPAFRRGWRPIEPGIALAEILEHHDDSDRAYRRVGQALRQRPDAVALYNTGGANRAVAAAIRDHGLAGTLLFLGHELTDASARLLQEGVMTVTIDQAPELQARRSIDLMLSRLGVLASARIRGNPVHAAHARERLRVLREAPQNPVSLQLPRMHACPLTRCRRVPVTNGWRG